MNAVNVKNIKTKLDWKVPFSNQIIRDILFSEMRETKGRQKDKFILENLWQLQENINRVPIQVANWSTMVVMDDCLQ